MKEHVKGLVSICVPTYNRFNLISQLLDSILAQTYTNFEIIITDNSDNLKTKGLIESQYQDERIRYYKNEKNLGMDGNSLKALSFVNGEYLTFTPDDDIWIDKNKLQKQIDFFTKNQNIHTCFSNALHIYNDGTVHKSQFHSDYSKLGTCDVIKPESLQLSSKQPPQFVCILTAMMRTEKTLSIFQESWKYGSEEYFMWYLGGTDTQIGFCYDQLIAIRDGDHNWQVVSDNGELINYRQNDDRRFLQILAIWENLLKNYSSSLKEFDKNTQKYIFKLLIKLSPAKGFLYKDLFKSLNIFDILFMKMYQLGRLIKRRLK